MDCPRCAAELQPLKVRRNLEIDWCPACAGTWYDKGELEAALGAEDGLHVSGRGQDGRRGVQCPRCHAACTEMTWPEGGLVRIDHCTTCGGNWLDRGELEAILRDLEARRMPAPDVVETRALDGTVIRLPLPPARKKTRWGWVLTGAMAMVIIFGIGLGFARFGAMFSAFSSTRVEDQGALELWLASLPAFLLGGALVGRGSTDFAVKEAALASIAAAAVISLFAHTSLGPVQTLGLVAAGVVVGFVGGIIGERLQAS